MKQQIEIELVVPLQNLLGWMFWAEMAKIWLERHGYQTTIVERNVPTATWYLLSSTQPTPAEVRTLDGYLRSTAQMTETQNFQKQLAAMALVGATS